MNSKERFKKSGGINPLKESQVKLLNQTGNDDLARKVNEIVERLNKDPEKESQDYMRECCGEKECNTILPKEWENPKEWDNNYQEPKTNWEEEPSKDKFENELIAEVMEDYLDCAKNGGSLKEHRKHFEKLKNFISNLLSSQKQDMKDKIIPCIAFEVDGKRKDKIIQFIKEL